MNENQLPSGLAGLAAAMRAEVESPASGRGLWYRPSQVAADNITLWPTRRYLAHLRHAAQHPGARAKYRGRPTFKYRRQK